MRTKADIEREVARINERLRQRTLELRIDNFSKGLSFMIFSDDLADGECYLEYPDGDIELRRLSDRDDVLENLYVRTLTQSEADQVRKECGL